MHDLPLSDPADHILYLFLQTNSAILKTLEERISQDNVTIAQLRLLVIISSHNRPLTAAEISKYVFREKHTNVVTLNHLKRKGYIEKIRDQNDKRMSRIQITEKGNQLLAKNHQLLTSSVNRMMSCFAEDELQQFKRYLERLREEVFGLFGVKIVEPMDGFIDTK